MDVEDYLFRNRQRWDDLVEAHLKNSSYDIDKFRLGQSVLNDLERQLLGDLSGKKILHLQCHFGMDTLSLLLEGAKEVVGVDFSEKAINTASKLAKELGLNARFIQADVLHLTKTFEEWDSFDIVFTSYGTITWLPELQSWGRTIASYLKESGKFVFVDAHPFSHVFADEKVTSLVPEYNYFGDGSPLHFRVEGSYATSEKIEHEDEYSWPHTLEEIFNSLIDAGLEIKQIAEYPKVNWKMYPFLEKLENGWYGFPNNFHPKIPLLLSIVAEKS